MLFLIRTSIITGGFLLILPRWRNWQTRRTQELEGSKNPASRKRHGYRKNEVRCGQAIQPEKIPGIPLKSCPQGSKIGKAVPLLAGRRSADGRRRHADESVRRKQHTRTSGGIGIRGGLRIRWETVQVQVLSSAPNGNRRSLLPGKEARRPFFFFSAKVLSDEFKFQTLSNRDAHGEEIISLRMRGWPQGEEARVLPLPKRLWGRSDLLR